MPESPILVLGASGQVGAALARQLGPRALPAARSPRSDNWLRLDLSHLPPAPALDRLLAEHNLSAVICSAGATDVERCEADIAWATAANHTGPAALARAARAAHIPFIFFSTDYVFDGEAGPYDEDAPANPLSVYGQTKFDGERAVLDAHPAALVLRSTTVFGPDPQEKNFLYTLRRLLSSGQTIRVPLDQFATPTCNEDLAAATLALLQAGHTGLFHVAGPDFLSRVDFARLACDLLGLDASRIEPLATAALHQRARRPLLGGLRIQKLRSKLPDFCIRTTAQALRDWHRMDQTTVAALR